MDSQRRRSKELTFAELRNQIRRGNHCLYQSLDKIAQFSTTLWKYRLPFMGHTMQVGDQEYYAPDIGQWHLAFIAKEIVFSSNDFRPNPLLLEDIQSYANHYTNLSTAGDEPSADTNQESVRFHLAERMIPLDYEQITWQAKHPLFEIGRTVVMFLDIGPTITADPFDAAGTFRRFTGITIEEFVTIGLLLHHKAVTDVTGLLFPSELFTSPSSERPISQQTVSMFLDHISTTYSALRDQVREEEKSFLGYEKRAFNPLVRWPIVQTTQRHPRSRESRFAIPIPMLLLDRITQGIYWDIVESSNDRSSSTPFHRFFGQVFQAYVGELLRDYFDNAQLYPEQSYETRQGTRLSCDWIIFEHDTVILVECKTGRYSKKTKITAQKDDLKDDLRNAAKGLAQLIATKRAIQAGLIKGLPQVSSDTQFRGIIVFLDHIYLAPLILGQDIIEQAKILDSTITLEEVNSLPHMVVSIFRLEIHCHRIPKFGLRGIFDPKSLEPPTENSSSILPPLLERCLKTMGMN